MVVLQWLAHVIVAVCRKFGNYLLHLVKPSMCLFLSRVIRLVIFDDEFALAEKLVYESPFDICSFHSYLPVILCEGCDVQITLGRVGARLTFVAIAVRSDVLRCCCLCPSSTPM